MKSILHIKMWYNDTQQTWSAICRSFVISKKRYRELNDTFCLDGHAYHQIRFFLVSSQSFFTQFCHKEQKACYGIEVSNKNEIKVQSQRK